MKEQPGQWIGGRFEVGRGAPLISRNPFDGKTVWQGRMAEAGDVKRAVDAALQAWPAWAESGLEQRIGKLSQYSLILAKKSLELAKCISAETGKPLWESKTEVQAMVNKVAIAIDSYHQRCHESREQLEGYEAWQRFRPIGVTAVLGPFNLPGHLPNGHMVPALLAGNTVIFKPSEFTPQTGVFMAECLAEAGLPEAVVQLLQGAREVGQALIKDKRVKGLFFTGSYATGQAIHRSLAGQPERLLALEMGGNNPLVVEEVRDMRAAIYHVMMSAFITSGQRCVCARRLMVPDSKWGEAFIEALLVAARAIRVGHWSDMPEPFMGALIHAGAAKRVLEMQQQFVDLGGRLRLEAKPLPGSLAALSAGVVDMTGVEGVPDEEVFGPLLQIYRTSNFDEACGLAAKSEYGLAAGLISDNKAHYDLFLRRVPAGILNWNRQITGASSKNSFGGVGKSGNFRPSASFASDYCSYPVASLESASVECPTVLPPGLTL